MKTKLLSLILIAFSLSNSCKKDNSSDLFPCRAIVSGKAGCTYNNIFILKFVNGNNKAKSLAVGESGQGREDYYAVPNLPDELKIEGLTIVLDIRKPLKSEIPPCYNFEMPMLWAEAFVYVIWAKKE